MEANDIRILKKDTCPSLMNKSILTYQIGCNERSEILLCIEGNTGSGIYSKEWVPLFTLLDLIAESDGPFTWSILQPLFKNRSVNTACFLLAALKNEGLVTALERSYERVDPENFMSAMKILMGTKKRPSKKSSK
ncbi:hypothetical protein JCM30471_29720 [Desulfuromonas carbonis]